MAAGAEKSWPTDDQAPAGGVPGPMDIFRCGVNLERWACDQLDALAAGRLKPDGAMSLARFLAVDLQVHFSNETKTLFALLEQRCKASDNIQQTLSEGQALQLEISASSAKVCRMVIAQMARLRATGATKALKSRAESLAANLRRLTAIESGIVLPLAAARLSGDDLRGLADGLTVLAREPSGGDRK